MDGGNANGALTYQSLTPETKRNTWKVARGSCRIKTDSESNEVYYSTKHFNYKSVEAVVIRPVALAEERERSKATDPSFDSRPDRVQTACLFAIVRWACDEMIWVVPEEAISKKALPREHAVLQTRDTDQGLGRTTGKGLANPNKGTCFNEIGRAHV